MNLNEYLAPEFAVVDFYPESMILEGSWGTGSMTGDNDDNNFFGN